MLIQVKRRALRNRVWFQALSQMERGLLDLAMKWLDQVRSAKLASVLAGLLTKLSLAVDWKMQGALQKGWHLARKISDWALKWGNASARPWGHDPNFQKALGLGILSPNPI